MTGILAVIIQEVDADGGVISEESHFKNSNESNGTRLRVTVPF